jgi:hypothetical protein
LSKVTEKEVSEILNWHLDSSLPYLGSVPPELLRPSCQVVCRGDVSNSENRVKVFLKSAECLNKIFDRLTSRLETVWFLPGKNLTENDLNVCICSFDTEHRLR